MSSTTFVISLVFLLTSIVFINGEGQEIKFSKCQKFQRGSDGVARQYEQSCTIHKVVVDPCPEAANDEPCKVKHGQVASIKFDFTPQFGASNVTASPYWDQSLMHIPYESMDTNACAFMKCPMEKDVRTSYNFSLNIKPSFPADTYTVKWKLQSVDDSTKECCFRFRVKVVP